MSTPITPNELAKLFPGASKSCLTANSAAPGAEPKQVVRDGALAEEKREAGYAGRVHVIITSLRTRLIDPDNLCAKYFLDCVRYAGLIKNDRAADIELTVKQEKVKTKAEEKTVIELIPL